MSRLVPPILVALLFAAGPARARWHQDFETARAEAREHGKLVFVDLYAEWCGWCKVLEREVFSSPAFRELAEKRFVLLRVDTEDGGEGTDLQLRYDATSLPTALMLDPRGLLVGAIVGYAETADYLRMIHDELARHQSFEASFPRRLAGSDLGDLFDLADELVSRRDGERAAVVFDRILGLGTLPADEIPWTLYQRADALRMAGRWSESLAVLEEGLAAASREQDSRTAERLALLRYQIARDRGDCRAEREALERFLAEHPDSELSPLARKSLQQLEREEGPRCS